jgi:Tfp pilus assembly protein PilF
MYFFEKKIEPARKQLEKTLRISPGFPEAVNLMGWIYLQKKEYQKARELFEDARKIPGNEPESVSGLARLYARSGETAKAAEYLDILLDIEKNMPDISISIFIASVYADLKDFENMMLYLEKCIENREAHILVMHNGPAFDPYRSDPGFSRLIKKIGLPGQ